MTEKQAQLQYSHNRSETSVSEKKTCCAHCGEICTSNTIKILEDHFCCEGCKSVYEILKENDLCTYYQIDKNAGTKQLNNFSDEKFAFLDDPLISEKLIQYTSDNISIVQFSLPQIHCSSCIWLIEKLYRINKGILESKVDIERKTVKIKFDQKITNLRQVVEALCKIGYTPDLTLDKIGCGRILFWQHHDA
jgi:P-type Cu+ transporter